MSITPQLTRIYAATKTRTQVELANVLDIHQSSISDAKRRCSIPDGWLVTLLRLYALNPEWILTGSDAMYLAPAGDDFEPPVPVDLGHLSSQEKAADKIMEAARMISEAVDQLKQTMQARPSAGR